MKIACAGSAAGAFNIASARSEPCSAGAIEGTVAAWALRQRRDLRQSALIIALPGV